MADLDSALADIAAARRADPLAPVTVIAPSHVAAIQMRRRLVESGAFAGVRFETLPRLAELLGAADLAAAGRSPLARPIGDYAAFLVSRESGAGLVRLRDMPGYPRVLRQIFRRFRRGGMGDGASVRAPLGSGHLAELLRLYTLFRQKTAQFYDEEDLFDAASAAVGAGRAAAALELGDIYVVPPAGESAGSHALLEALAHVAPAFQVIDEDVPRASTRFVLAPDPATEAREAVREVVGALEEGLGLHEVAIFHGADRAYRKLLREALDAAGIPAALMPGTPLVETPAGRAVLGLARLPEEDYSRTALMDLLAIDLMPADLPAGVGRMRAAPSAWERLSRDAGVTHGLERWRRGLHSLSADREAEIAESELEAEDWRRQRAETDLARAQDLLVFVEELARRLSALAPDQPAAAFIRSFREVVRDYVRPGVRHLDAVVDEIDQLGTVGAIGGSFSLESFTRAFAANLEAATTRETSLGAGIFVGDYRLAAGMSFRHVVLSGAFEGALPAGPGTEPLMEDAVWAELRRAHPFIEDAALRVERARQAASRATAAAGDGSVVWTAPLYQPGGTREYYPAPPMVSDAARADPRIRTATDLRLARSLPGLRRGDSPLAMMLSGAAADSFEASLRDAVEKKQHDLALGPGHALQPSLRLLRARRGRYFSEYDGNLAALVSTGGFGLERRLSPTTLEDYGACGFRYLCRSVLRLNVVEEPEERETMEPAARGLLVHRVLERFFVEESEKGRPKAREPWTAADADRLLEIADEELDRARARGQTGLDIYVEHEARSVRADLVAFLEHDSVFRAETGGVPSEFEVRTPEIEVAGLRLRGRADRIDRTPDGRRAWVIDYKTGSKKSYSDMERDPLKGGTRLQLPVYMAAAGDAEELRALYWFVSRKGEFERAEFVATREHMERYGRTLQAIAQSIGRGIFAAVPGEENLQFSSFENCRYCDFDRICSRRRDAELVDKSSDPALAYWFAIGEAASP